MRLTTIWTIRHMTIRERFNRTAECGWRTLAHHLPRKLAYWSLIDTGVRAIGNDVVPEVTFMEVLERTGKSVGDA